VCGIVGWVQFGRAADRSSAVLDAMVATLRRRGPDGTGTWINGPVALGHRRLAVIDLVGGHQPMTVEMPNGAVTITYSGEAYNYRDLRRELESRGHRFTTVSDTEVVLRGYLEWGEDLPTKLNGMFAFAVWDGRRQALVLARDRLGVKPLYYEPIADGVLFASEPKAILAHPDATRVVDLDGLRRSLAFTVTIPGVAWAGMHEVEPGELVAVGPTGIRTRRYWRLTTREHGDDAPTTVARVRALLDDIVRRQLIADVPVGVMLSGGLDSSTLTALAAATGDEIDTYEIDFVGYGDHFVANRERAAPDAPFVADVVAHLGTRHRRIVLDHRDVADPDLRRTVVQAYDVPPGSGDRDRSLHLLFRTIRDASTVVLSGEAADEVFGGYATFHDPAAQRAETFPWIASSFDTYGPAPGVFRRKLDRALDLQGHIASAYEAATAEVEHLDGASAQERRMRLVHHLYLTRSVRVLLDRKDRVSMATGLEVRVPYCDHRLVEYVYNAPWGLKAFDGREKSLLRAAVADLLPASVLQRVKTAYPSIAGPSYVQALQHQAADLVADGGHEVFAIVDPTWLIAATREPPDALPPRTRNTLEWALNVAAWLDTSHPTLALPC
jgi:asparagine synthase (glutamine-hydrolysing)